MTVRYAAEMSKDEFAKAMKKNPVNILPIGAMEEHGSHLPLGTDSFEINFVVERLADKIDSIVLPIIPYGECKSTYNFPGTISISFDSLRMLVRDIIDEIVRHGGKKIVIISGHAGGNHMTALKMASQEAVKNIPSLKIMVLSDYDLAPEYKDSRIPKWDGHAGMVETSRMLNIRPDLSRRGQKATKMKDRNFMILPDPEKLFPTGVMGDPRKASAELGKKIDDFILRRLVKLVRNNMGE